MTAANFRWIENKFKDRFLCSTEEPLVLGAIYPNDKSELSDLIAHANQNKLRLHVVSSGKNWGFGNDRPLAREPYFIVHLKNMNRILEFNEKLAYIVIEPGVTYEQLHLYLQEKTDGRLLIDAPGSSMQASVIGNLLERGHGQTPYSDHIEQACHFEILLGNGKILKTGFGALGPETSPELKNIDKWGLGPSLEGLFSQSNFGVVTQATVWLLTKPQNISLLQLGFSNENLSHVADHLAQMRIRKQLQAGPHFANVYFLLSRLFQLHQLTDQPFLSYPLACKIAKENGISEWNANLVLYGTNDHVSSVSDSIQAELKSFLTSSKLSPASHLRSTSTDKDPSDGERFLQQIAGLRGGTGISRMFWRKKKSRDSKPLYDADIEKDQLGVFCTPIACPPTGQTLVQIQQILQQTCEKFQTEPFLAAFMTRDRLFHLHNFLIFDHQSADQQSRHQLCADEINRQIYKAGFAPHRLGSDMSLNDYQPSSTHLEILKLLKGYCDPEGIFVDQRYVPDGL